MTEQPYGADDIAVIGMALHVPGADDIDTFWENLRDGVESIKPCTEQELDSLGVSAERRHHPHFVNAAGLIPGVSLFDHQFWGYSPREAALLDPQQRLFLETAWESLEHAGYDPFAYDGAIGVYAGMGLSRYLLRNLLGNPDVSDADSPMLLMGNDKDFLATRVSYHLNLRGPSLAVQTGCSTSLVATHLAVDALLSYQCDLALVGGATVTPPQLTGYLRMPGSTASPDGHSRAFDAEAAGTVFGNGVAAVVLKRLPEAVADRDTIHAVIKGSAVNNDGAGKVGFAAPGISGQAEVIVRAQRVAEVTADTVSYVEAHGTATRLGDPAEVAALTRAFRDSTDQVGYCALGSVKTNVGHLDTAAGVTGLIKAALALSHGQIPASLHFTTPNPEIDFERSPFYVNTELRAWPRGATPRRAGVSAFGFGGTNAHVVLEEPPRRAPTPAGARPQVLVLSAKTADALEHATSKLADQLRDHPDQSLVDIAYTTQVGRARFAHRRSVVCRDHKDAVELLSAPGDPRWRKLREARQERTVAFMFSGVGDQYVGMTQDLYEDEPVFAAAIDECAESLGPHLGLDLRDVLYPERGAPRVEGPRARGRLDMAGMFSGAPPEDVLRATTLAYPAVFCVEYALARQLTAWGVRPAALIGHSLGEYVAATVAGVFTLHDALRLIVHRARLIDELPGGAMLAVSLSPDALRPRLTGSGLSIALLNGLRLTVVAGPSEAVDALARELSAEEIACRPLGTRHAFHTPSLEPMVAPFTEALRTVELSPPVTPLLSNMTGTWLTAAEATDPEYWGRQSARTVDFAGGLRELCADRDHVLLEVGPGQALCSLAAEHLLDADRPVDGLVLPSVRTWYDHRESDTSLLQDVLGRLWLAGADVDWPAVHAPRKPGRVPLPSYPFERTRAWVDPPAPGAVPASGADTGERVFAPSWRSLPFPVADPPNTTAAGERWLILADGDGVARALARRILDNGGAALLVEPGTGFEPVDEERIRIDPARSEDYDALADHLTRTGFGCTHVAHLWSLDPGHGPQEDPARALTLGFRSLAYTARALAPRTDGRAPASRTEDEPLRIWVVTSGIATVESGDALRPETAALRGPALCAPQEYPKVSVDIVDAGTWAERPAALAERLLTVVREPTRPRATQRLTAFRGDRRWLPGLEPLPLSDTGPAPYPLRPGGVCLITGGLSRIGLDIADELATRARARLALATGVSFPAAEQWPDWLAEYGPDDPTSRLIVRLRAMRDRGADVLVVRADTTDRTSTHAAIDAVEKAFGQVNAVVQAEGAPAREAVAPLGELATGQDCAEAVPRAQVAGCRVLVDLFGDADLDFCLLVSSNAALLGGIGLTGHSAGSAYLDATACRQRALTGRRWISVNLEEWAEPDTSRRPDGTPRYAIAPDDGVRVVRRLMEWCDEPQVSVVTSDLEARLDRWVRHPGHEPARSLAPESPRHPRPPLDTAFVAPDGERETTIATVWQDVLGIEGIGRDDNFYALGGHSLLATQVVARVRSLFDLDIPLVSLFGAPTVAGFAERVARLISPVPDASGAPSATRAEPSPGAGPPPLLRQLGPRRDTGPRLLCFPYAGGGASVFQEWGRLLPAHIELWAVQLPGREDRLLEPPTSLLDPLLDALERALLPLLDRPFVFFGHSMGAIVSWSLADRMREKHRVQPDHLFVSGCRPPNLGAPRRPWHHMPDEELIAELRRMEATPDVILTDPELRRLFLPTIRADLTIAESYQSPPGRRLTCPTTAFRGSGDVHVPLDRLRHWGALTEAAFDWEEFTGSHLFLAESREAVVEQIVRRLSSP